MSDGRNLICTFDGTFDGFLSVVYYAVKNRLRPVKVCVEDMVQLELDSVVEFIETNIHHSEHVRNSLMDIMGYEGFRRAYYVFLNSHPDSATISYTYILYGLKYGKNTYNYMSVPDINLAYKLERQVVYEVDRMKGILRFCVMDKGVEYAPMETEHDILALLMIHFSDRLKNIPFVIHDLLRQKAGVYRNGTWFITDAAAVPPPKANDDEKKYRDLWKKFYNTICIRERTNLKLQNNMLPKKYRKHMTEFM